MTLFLGGGGSADDESALWHEALVDVDRLALWPHALPPSQFDVAHRWLASALRSYGSPTIDLWRDLAAHAPHDLDEVDLVWVVGGNTYALLDHVRRSGWVDRLRAWITAGGRYYGGSAGAVLMGADIDVARFADPNDVGLTDTRGIDLLGPAVVRPHWTGRPREHDEAAHWVSDHGWSVIGLPEDAGLVVTDAELRATGRSAVTLLDADGVRTLAPGASIPR